MTTGQWTPDNNSNQQTSGDSWGNVGNVLGWAAKSLMKPITPTKMNMTSGFEKMGKMTSINPPSTSSSAFNVTTPKLPNTDALHKSINDNSAKLISDASLTTATGLTNGLNIADQIAKPLSQGISAGVTALGGTVADSGMSSALSSISGVAGAIGGPGVTAAIEGVALVNNLIGGAMSNKAGTNKTLNVNTGSSGYGSIDSNTDAQGKTFGATDFLFGAPQKFKTDRNLLAQQAGQARNLVNQSNFQQEARIAGTGNVAQRNTSQLNNAFNKQVFMSKKGSKLDKLKEEKNNLISNRNKPKSNQHGSTLDQIESFKQGGEVNVIPSGALHAHKNHLEDTNNEMTKKGIPVINIAKKGDVLEFEKDGKTPKVLAEGGEVIQHAEIERNEVILHLTLTQQLEKLKKDNTPESTIEAGKLLAKELMENTEDNTNLIDKLLENEN